MKRKLRRLISVGLLVLILTSLLVVFDLQLVMAEYWGLDVTMTPQYPSISDQVNVTVSFTFGSEPPYVEEFGPIYRNGNIFSANVTVYLPTPWDWRVFWVHTDSYIYCLGNLSTGEYEFQIYVQTVHWNEGYGLERTVPFIVSIRVPQDYTTIQEAINAANEGDTIFVRNGTYYENVVVNKTVSLIGENRNTTILDGEEQRWPVAINHTSHVDFRGFTVQNSLGIYGYGGGGVYLEESDNCIVTDNILNNNQYGIGLYGSSNNVIYDNLLIENAANALVLSYFPHNLACNNSFFNNTLTGASYGPAFELCEMTECTIIGNTIANNKWGIMIFEPYATYPHNNHTIYHNNFINNTFQVRINEEDPTVYQSKILWDNGCEGNYWSDHNGTDSNDDGISDIPYTINKNNTDRHPLMNVYWNPCDINHDLKVDMKDVGSAARAFDTQEGNPDWNPHTDISGPEYLVPDGTVDMRDIALIARNFGEEYQL